MEQGIEGDIAVSKAQGNNSQETTPPLSEKQVNEINRINVERIRTRDPQDLKDNANRALNALEELYISQELMSIPQPMKLLPNYILERYLLKKLRKKVSYFQKEFDTTFFNNIVHATLKSMPDEPELKSPNYLAKEKGLTIEGTSSHTGGSDIEIGNSDYVFAGSLKLPSRGMAMATGEDAKIYRINSENGYAVPVDIADLQGYEEWHYSQQTETWMDFLKDIYANNIYTIKDFKKVFSTYSAVLFESPNQAINSLHNIWTITFGTPWTETQLDRSLNNMEQEHHPLPENQKKALLLMRTLLRKHKLYPPFEPEFQFKDRVKGNLMETTKSLT